MCTVLHPFLLPISTCYNLDIYLDTQIASCPHIYIYNFQFCTATFCTSMKAQGTGKKGAASPFPLQKLCLLSSLLLRLLPTWPQFSSSLRRMLRLPFTLMYTKWKTYKPSIHSSQICFSHGYSLHSFIQRASLFHSYSWMCCKRLTRCLSITPFM